MKTVTYKSILDRVAGYMGESAGLSDEEAVLANTKVNLYARAAWLACWWPEWTDTEKRRFRLEWDGTTLYAAGAEVYLPGPRAYYQALQATLDEPPAEWDGAESWSENSAYWAQCASRYSGQTWASGLVLAIGDRVQNPWDREWYQCIAAHTTGPTFDSARFGKLALFTRIIGYETRETTPGLAHAAPQWVVFQDGAVVRRLSVANGVLMVQAVDFPALGLAGVDLAEGAATWRVTLSGGQLVVSSGTATVRTDRVPLRDGTTGAIRYLTVEAGQLVVT